MCQMVSDPLFTARFPERSSFCRLAFAFAWLALLWNLPNLITLNIYYEEIDFYDRTGAGGPGVVFERQ